MPSLALILVVVGVLHGVVAPTPPSFSCRVCEDVMQTMHDKWQCAGNYMNFDDMALGNAGDGQVMQVAGCQTPLDCSKFPEAEANKCVIQQDKMWGAKELDFISNELYSEGMWRRDQPIPEDDMGWLKLWKNNENNMHWVWKYCGGEGQEEKVTELVKVFYTDCRHKRICPPLWNTKKFPFDMAVCVLLMNDMPVFQEACALPLVSGKLKTQQEATKAATGGASTTKRRASISLLQYFAQSYQDNVLSDDSTAFLQLESEVRKEDGETKPLFPQPKSLFPTMKKETKSLFPSMPKKRLHRHLFPAFLQTQGSSSPEMRFAQVKEMIAVQGKTDAPTECKNTWKDLIMSNKARYFASYKNYATVDPTVNDRLKGKMWDANVACKCMGRCDLQPLENLQLIDVCKYDMEKEQGMSLMFSNID